MLRTVYSSCEDQIEKHIVRMDGAEEKLHRGAQLTIKTQPSVQGCNDLNHLNIKWSSNFPVVKF
jgi:hypothetical protein